MQIDLNADLGEYRGDAAQLAPYITTANVACGGHAGGGIILEETIAEAIKHGIQIGAHPSYPDRENFGRESLWDNIPLNKLTESIQIQIQTVIDAAAVEGLTLSHIKAHGSLYNDMMKNKEIANYFLDTVKKFNLPVMGMPHSVLEVEAEKLGTPFICEGFVDRLYEDDYTLTSRKEKGSVLHSAEAVWQGLLLAKKNVALSKTGRELALPVETICVHGDTEDSFATIKELRKLCEKENIQIKKFTINS